MAHLQLLAQDISSGQEPCPLPVSVPRSKLLLPLDFHYHSQLEAHALPVLTDAGCSCAACHCSDEFSNSSSCPCAAPQPSSLHKQPTHLHTAKPQPKAAPSQQQQGTADLQQDQVIKPLNGKSTQEEAVLQGTYTECGPACACHVPRHESQHKSSSSRSCSNRLTQRGVVWQLRLVYGQKGWSVHAAAPIPAHSFVCEYVGERLSRAEAKERLKAYDAQRLPPANQASEQSGGAEHSGPGGHALLTVREVLPSGLSLCTSIDATRHGNVARFINHACSAASLTPVIVRRSGSMLPAVGLFASRDIQAGEELTFSYGPPNDGSQGTARRCYCGASECGGFMPSSGD